MPCIYYCLSSISLQIFFTFHCMFQILSLLPVFPLSETGIDEDEDLYDCVYGEDEGGEVYEDLMKAEAVCFFDIKVANSPIQQHLQIIYNMTETKLSTFLSSVGMHLPFCH